MAVQVHVSSTRAEYYKMADKETESDEHLSFLFTIDIQSDTRVT